MKAAVFRGPHQPLSIEEVPVPTPAPGEALIRTVACGVCATDLHYLHGTPTFHPPPVTLGHEISGIVEKVTREGGSIKPGDRVLLPSVISCGHCSQCRVGRDNICESMVMFGNHINGGFAPWVVAPQDSLVKIPEEVPLEESCLIADALSTPFHAVKNRGQVRAGETVAIFGCGGVGINAVQAAAAFGAQVIAVDIDPGKLELARKLGAVETLNAKEGDAPKAIRKLTRGGVDAAFEVIGNPVTLQAAFDSVRTGGRLVTVGYSEQDWTLRASRVMFREISILGSLGCRSAEYPVLMDLVRRGRLQLAPLVSRKLPLEKVNEALDDLEKGRVMGRQIIVFPEEK
ncbi:MAG: zinc-binding dehydrogenase [Candidatus Thermoplasmatota archaeon]|jgi:6-hydroxycyclohex-1-ene-1-carbonyl-CoA dehydrogenase|nr:zinc-binding dehydrogenase [Candidatus Thermoplasmatota archaeon]